MRGLIESVNFDKMVFRLSSRKQWYGGRIFDFDLTKNLGHRCEFRRGAAVTFDLAPNQDATNVRLAFSAFEDVDPVNHREESTIAQKHPNYDHLFFARRCCNSCQIGVHLSEVITYGEIAVGTRIYHGIRFIEDWRRVLQRNVLRPTATAIEIFQDDYQEIQNGNATLSSSK